MPLQALLVLTKAQDCEAALSPLLSWLDPAIPIVLLHNGQGPQQRLLARYPKHNWWWGTLSDGAQRIGACEIHHTGSGLRVAGPAPTCPWPGSSLPKALHRLGFTLHQDINTALWQKLTVNAVINPLAARDRITNGTLLSPIYQGEIGQLCEELALLGQHLTHTDSANQIHRRVLAVAKATASNRCSTLQDIDAERETELACITGCVLTLAKQQGLTLSNHKALLDSLKPQTVDALVHSVTRVS
ncbi:hypothetical protein GCM10023333_08890 [Ferrimonas pelagia]|uniref:2-dehydropantoate 2-reductase n=1 Tax=Ferrimonas pelagia TaxID=1177826 RepID=A0ABP9EGR8_9GAMM